MLLSCNLLDNKETMKSNYCNSLVFSVLSQLDTYLIPKNGLLLNLLQMCLSDIHSTEEEHESCFSWNNSSLVIMTHSSQEWMKVLANHEHVTERNKNSLSNIHTSSLHWCYSYFLSCFYSDYTSSFDICHHYLFRTSKMTPLFWFGILQHHSYLYTRYWLNYWCK